MYFILFRQGGRAQITRLVLPTGKGFPTRFQYEGRDYNPEPSSLANGDHFLTKEKALAGFSFILGGDSAVADGRLGRECHNVEIESGQWLKIFLSEAPSPINDCCQFIYPQVYHDGKHDHIVMLDECPGCWTALDFRLATPPFPHPIFETED